MTSTLGVLLLALTCHQSTSAQPPKVGAPLTSASPIPQAPRHEGPFKWWDDDDTVKALNLSKRQRARIRSKFEAWVPGQRTKLDELHAADKALSELLEAPSFDVNAAARAIERLEEARWHMSRSRSLMLLDLLSELNLDQRKKLRELNVAASPGRGRQREP